MSTKVSKNLISNIDPSQITSAGATDGQVLTFDGTTNRWIARSSSTAVAAAAGPVKLLGIPRYVYASHMMAVLNNNKVIGFGGQSAYQIDLQNNNHSPQQQAQVRFWTADNQDYFLTSNANIIDLQVSTWVSMALLDDGTVWVNGYNRNNWLGVENLDINTYTYGFMQVKFPAGVFIRSICLNTDNSDGYECFAAVSSADDLYMWGSNDNGQLGQGNTTRVTTPTRITTTGIASNVSKAVLGGSENPCACVVTKTGDVYVCGYNGYGQLGLGNTVEQTTFVRAKTGASTNLTGVVDIVTPWWGMLSNLFLIKSDGTVWAAGDNSAGQLGTGNTTASTYFTRCGASMTNITKVVGGGYRAAAYNSMYMIAMDSAGGVWTWGYNGHGELGQGTTTNQSTPTRVLTSGASDIITHNGFNTGGATGYIRDGVFYAAGYNVFTERGQAHTSTHYPLFMNNVKSAVFRTGGIDNASGGDNYGIFVLTNDGGLYGIGISDRNDLGTSDQNVKSLIKLL